MSQQFEEAEQALQNNELRQKFEEELRIDKLEYLIQAYKDYEMDPETKKRIDAFSTPIQDGTMSKIVP